MLIPISLCMPVNGSQVERKRKRDRRTEKSNKADHDKQLGTRAIMESFQTMGKSHLLGLDWRKALG